VNYDLYIGKHELLLVKLGEGGSSSCGHYQLSWLKYEIVIANSGNLICWIL